MEDGTEQENKSITEAGDNKTESKKIEGESENVVDDNNKVDQADDIKEGGEQPESEHTGTEYAESEHVNTEHVEEEQREKALQEGDDLMAEHIEGEHTDGEYIEGEHIESEQMGEEHVEGEEEVEKQEELKAAIDEFVEEEEKYVEEPPPDPTAPYDFSDSKEALREPFELRPDQLMEVEMLWAEFQNYTPAYTNLDNYITEKELVYMLKSLLLMTFTPEQLVELIDFCVKPPHPEGHITYEQFLKMVILRQRDFPVEEELRSALQVYDPDKTGTVDREYLKETLSKQGHKMPAKQLDNLIKEVDLSNDGTIGIEDVVGTMCIDLNPEDLQMLRDALNPSAAAPRDDNM